MHCRGLAAACLVLNKIEQSDGLQVSVYETINRAQQYSKKVRMLGEFHPQLAQTKVQDGQDIDDPLYGNMGGPDEQVRLQMLLVTLRTAQGVRWWRPDELMH